MTVVDVTGSVFSFWQETIIVVKSSFLDLVQLVGQDGVPITNERRMCPNDATYMYKSVLSYIPRGYTSHTPN